MYYLSQTTIERQVLNGWFETVIMGYRGMNRGTLQAKMLPELQPYLKRLLDYWIIWSVFL